MLCGVLLWPYNSDASEQNKLSKTEVVEKVTPVADFWVSADNMCQQVALLSQWGRAMLRICQ